MVLAVVLCIGYGAAVIYASGTYEGLSMDTSYNWAHYQKRAINISKGFIANPAKPVLVKLTDQEVEGFLKLAIKNYSGVSPMIKGAKISLNNNELLTQVNISAAGFDKGVQLSAQPSITADGKLRFVVKGLRIGKYHIPVTPSFLVLKGALPSGIVELQGNTVILDLKDMPFHIDSLSVEAGSLTAGLIISPERLLQMATTEKAIITSVVTKAESLKKDLKSKAATSLIDSIKQKQEITPGDVEQAKSIFESLSPADREVIQKNMANLLQDPTVQEIIEKHGIKP